MTSRWYRIPPGIMVLALLACGDASSPEVILARIDLRHFSRSVAVKDQASLVAVAFSQGNRVIPVPPLTWTSDDPTIASVDEMGRVSGHRIGVVQIRATAPEGVQGTIGISVRAAELRISLRSGAANMVAGERSRLIAELLDAEGGSIASAAPISWSSADSGIVALRPVAASGWEVELSAVSAGLATVTARVGDEHQSYVLAVLNQPPPANAPLQIAEFAFFEFMNMSDFVVFGPALRVRIADGRTVEILRVDVLVPTQPRAFPALCSSRTLSVGQHEVLGPVSYSWDLFESFRFFSPPPVNGVVLLTYRADDGEVYQQTARGQHVAQAAPFMYAAGYRWTACAA